LEKTPTRASLSIDGVITNNEKSTFFFRWRKHQRGNLSPLMVLSPTMKKAPSSFVGENTNEGISLVGENTKEGIVLVLENTSLGFSVIFFFIDIVGVAIVGVITNNEKSKFFFH
jgi:hypothetical protein